MRSHYGQNHPRPAARRAMRKALLSVLLLEERALLAQTVSVPGMGALTNLPLTELKFQQLVLNLTPNMTNANGTVTNRTAIRTSSTLNQSSLRSFMTIGFSGIPTSPTTRTFSFHAAQDQFIAVASTPVNLRLRMAPTRPPAVVAPTNTPPTPFAAAAPEGPLAFLGHHGQQHHHHAHSGGHHRPH